MLGAGPVSSYFWASPVSGQSSKDRQLFSGQIKQRRLTGLTIFFKDEDQTAYSLV